MPKLLSIKYSRKIRSHNFMQYFLPVWNPENHAWFQNIRKAYSNIREIIDMHIELAENKYLIRLIRI